MTLHWPIASLRSYLLVALLVATLPLAALMSTQLLDTVRQQQAQRNEQLQRSADSLAMSIERELQSSLDALDILAHAEPVARDGLEGLRRQVQQPGLPRQSWSGLYVQDARGRTVFGGQHSPPPTAGTRPPDGAESARVSNLIDGPLGDGATALDVPLPATPAIGPADSGWRVGASITSTTWQRLVDGAGAPAGGFMVIVDRAGRVIARTHAAASTGARLPDQSLAAIAAAGPDVLRYADEAGSRSDAAWRSVPASGWRVAAGVPSELVDSAEQQARARVLVTVIGCVLVGVGAALLVAQQVTGPLQRLTVDSGAGTPTPPSSVSEIALLQAALAAAHQRSDDARQRLQRKADDFETLFGSSPIGLVFAQHASGRDLLRNAAFDRLHAPGDDGQPPTVWLDGRPLDDADLPIRQALTQGQPIAPVELELRASGQAPSFVLMSAVPLLSADGTPRGAIAAAVDVTERKRAMAQQIDTADRLRSTQRMMELAQEAGHAGFFDHAFASDRLRWTSGQAMLFGLGPHPFESRLDGWLARVDEVDRARVMHSLQAAFAAQLTRLTVDHCVSLTEHHARWLSTRLLIGYGSDGAPEHMIGITVDMSEQRKTERERDALIDRTQAARDEAEAANRSKDEFLAMLGHELRNPLNAITAAVEVMNRADAHTEAAASARAIMTRQTRKMGRLLEDLLDVARLLSGRIVLTRQRVDLGAQLQRFMQSLQLGGATGQHVVALELGEAWVDVDTTRIEQVANGLLSNALRYTPAGGLITVRVRTDGTDVLMEVQDNGAGIPGDLLPRIFDLFVQGTRPLDRSAGGLGLGLTVVRRLVELHGGSVSATSSPAGSRFTVRLPAAAPPPPTPLPAPVPRTRPRRIVLIDDNRDAVDALKTRLEFDGHTVWTAEDGQAGLALVLEQRPDLAIVDIGLPLLDGYQVTRQSRAGGHAGRMVALSGYGQPSAIKEAMKAGFDAHLVKPLDDALLVREIAAI